MLYSNLYYTSFFLHSIALPANKSNSSHRARDVLKYLFIQHRCAENAHINNASYKIISIVSLCFVLFCFAFNENQKHQKGKNMAWFFIVVVAAAVSVIVVVVVVLYVAVSNSDANGLRN